MSFLKSVGLGGTLGAIAGGLALGPAGALIGAGLGGLSSYTTEAQNKANKKALQSSNQYDYWLWNQSNAYNSPVQQMQRLAEAGLNPNLVYGSGSVTGNTSGVANSNGVASISAQDYAKNALTNYQSLLTAKQMEAGIVNTEALTGQANANARNLRVQNDILDWNLDYAKNHGLPVGTTPTVATATGSAMNSLGKWISDKWSNSGFKIQPASDNIFSLLGRINRKK